MGPGQAGRQAGRQAVLTNKYLVKLVAYGSNMYPLVSLNANKLICKLGRKRFVIKARAIWVLPFRVGSDLTHNNCSRLESLVRDKHFSLFAL
jgi:hypothetical protein